MAVNEKSKDYLKNFELYLKIEKNFSSHTVKAYCADVLVFLIWASDKDVKEIDAKKFGEYLYFIQQMNYSKTTIARKIASIRAFYRFLYNREIIDYNPTDTTKGPKLPKTLPDFLTKEERDKIFESSPTSTRLQKIRDMFVFECFVGARISDLQALTKDNISEDGNYIEYIADKTIKENPRICRIPLSLKAKEILKRYDMPDGKLMPHISQQQYNDGIKELLKSLGISRKVIILDKHTMTQKSVPIYEVISSHNARKTFIASLKKAGKDDSVISSMSGHIKGSKAFGRYYAVDDEQKIDAIKDIE